MSLPPGFEFDPSDEELILHFLSPRAANLPCYPNFIPDLDISSANLWDLNEKAFRSKKKWYFFSGCGSRRKGLWKEVGAGGPIFTANGHAIGIKYHLVIHQQDGSNWFMEEYHVLDNASISTTSHQMRPEWVLCRVQELGDSRLADCGDNDSGVELSSLDEAFYSEAEAEAEDQEEISTFSA